MAQRRAEVKSKLSHKEWILKVVSQELDKERIDSIGELERVKAAIIAGRYDPVDGDEVPF